MAELSEVLGAQNEVTPINTSDAEAAIEKGKTSVEAAQADEREIYRRDNLAIEKRFRPSRRETWPRRQIELIVSQNGQSFSINGLLPEEWAIVENPFGTAPFADVGIKKVVLPCRMFLPPQMDEVVGLEKTESSMLPDVGIEKDGVLFEAHNLLALRGSLMMVLHEIGHVDDEAQFSEEEHIRERTIRARRVDEQKSNRNLALEELSETDLQDYVDTTYRSERAAWTQAFKRYRQIKKETGIDLAEGRSAREVIASGRACLTTYEGKEIRILPMYRNTNRKQQPPAASIKKAA